MHIEHHRLLWMIAILPIKHHAVCLAECPNAVKADDVSRAKLEALLVGECHQLITQRNGQAKLPQVVCHRKVIPPQ